MREVAESGVREAWGLSCYHWLRCVGYRDDLGCAGMALADCARRSDTAFSEPCGALGSVVIPAP